MSGGSLPESVRKFEWLLATFNGVNRPDVIFVAEVTGSVQELVVLCRWVRRKLKYDLRWLPGEGGSKRVDGAGISHANGIIAMVAMESNTFVAEERGAEGSRKAAVRVAERVFGVIVRPKGSMVAIPLVALHGLHTTASEGVETALMAVEQGARSFQGQLHAAEEWLLSNGGGLLVGDFNRVPCTSFRANPKYVLNEDDRALRRVCGFRCDCCAPTVDGPSRLVGRDGAVKVDWTHFDSTGAGVSRLDFGVEIGVSTGRWKLIDTFRPEWRRLKPAAMSGMEEE